MVIIIIIIIENIQTKMRMLFTRYRIHPRAAKKRHTLLQHMGGRGLMDIVRLHDKQVKLLHTYFLHKQATLPLHAAVVKADDRYTPLDLVCADGNEPTTDEEYNNEVKRQWSQKALHGRHQSDLSQQQVDIEASNKWLTSTDLFAETEGFLTAIQDQIILTRNYKKYILKQTNIDELCRRCGKELETIQHITAACEQLAPTEYVKSHDGLDKIIHQKLPEAAELIEDKSPLYKYTPANVLENDNFKLYWNRSILMDKIIPFNRPDITFMNKKTNNTFLIDRAVPNTHNLAKTITNKQNKYQELVNEISAMWGKNAVQVIPTVISST
jgi:hypothetical protein